MWIFPNVKGNHIEKTSHPCQFPIELPTRLILALTRAWGDLVVDPYLGVGSTAIAAVLNGRRVAEQTKCASTFPLLGTSEEGHPAKTKVPRV